MDIMESLLGLFMFVHVLIKIQFIVYNESSIFEAAHLFNCLDMDGGGFSPVWGVFDVLMTSSSVLSMLSVQLTRVALLENGGNSTFRNQVVFRLTVYFASVPL